jgi:Insertion element 4 transposase N-terminal/Transposase DDE domain
MEKVMHLEKALKTVGVFVEPERFESIRRHIPTEWVAQALEATGTATVRKRRLPAEQVVWLVIGMAMFRKWPIHDLVGKLDLVLPGPRATVAPSAVAEARTRVGAEPLEQIFEMGAKKWAHESARKHAWRDLALYGVDGSTLRVADSLENRAHFGGPSGDRGDSGYPLVRVATLMALRSHILAAAEFGPYSDSEVVLSAFLWREVPANSLVVVDRGFLAAGILVPLARDGQNRHWLTRGKSTTTWRTLKRLGKNEDLVELNVSAQARSLDPSLPATYLARLIRYQVKGFQPQTLLTSMLDPEQYPANEIVGLYHERWELELGYDEIKTEMLDRLESIRSRTVEGVKQELWGILLAFNLVRLEMERTADDLGVEPTRISFVSALRLVCDTWSWCALALPGALPARLKTMRDLFARLVLPDRRRSRRYPRAVKIKMSKFPRKRPANA